MNEQETVGQQLKRLLMANMIRLDDASARELEKVAEQLDAMQQELEALGAQVSAHISLKVKEIDQ